MAALRGLRAKLEAPGGVAASLSDGTRLDVAGCTATDHTATDPTDTGHASDGATTGNKAFEACGKKGLWDSPLPPVVSARLSTKGRFAFTRGTLEARVRVPVGDWLWSALWLLPVDLADGSTPPWPVSGEVDLLESRGNGPSFLVQRDGDGHGWPGGNNVSAATFHCADEAGDRVLASSPQMNVAGKKSSTAALSKFWA